MAFAGVFYLFFFFLLLMLRDSFSATASRIYSHTHERAYAHILTYIAWLRT